MIKRPSILFVYNILLNYFGPQNWWPAESNLEMIVGAILTQNTAWKNVELAIRNLKKENLLNYETLKNVKEEKLEQIVRSAGYYRQKTKKIKNFVKILSNYDGNLELLLDEPEDKLKEMLLSIKGIGEETADSIILYAAQHPIFVVDLYTLRIFKRLGYDIKEDKKDYEKVQRLVYDNIKKDVNTYKEFHALLVMLGKIYCRKKPVCDRCVLCDQCPQNL